MSDMGEHRKPSPAKASQIRRNQERELQHLDQEVARKSKEIAEFSLKLVKLRDDRAHLRRLAYDLRIELGLVRVEPMEP